MGLRRGVGEERGSIWFDVPLLINDSGPNMQKQAIVSLDILGNIPPYTSQGQRHLQRNQWGCLWSRGKILRLWRFLLRPIIRAQKKKRSETEKERRNIRRKEKERKKRGEKETKEKESPEGWKFELGAGRKKPESQMSAMAGG